MKIVDEQNNACDRRQLLTAIGGIAIVSGLASSRSIADKKEIDVTANEDLMREHGIIRRALLVYREASKRARSTPQSLPLPSLAATAKLFRQFGEDYHERALEEKHIFPVVRKLRTSVASLPDVLQQQHERGRQITDYILRITQSERLAAAEAERFATTLDNFVTMYEPHASREDTILFPAWKAALGDKAYAEMGDQFEEIEHKFFGHDGFDDALAHIEVIERAFGIDDLSKATAPLPAST